MSNDEMMPKVTVKNILEKILEVYNSDDAARKADLFEKELPNLLASEDFSYNPAKKNDN